MRKNLFMVSIIAFFAFIFMGCPQPIVELSSIAITKAATKVEYEIGEKLDTTGMEVTAKYSDGTEKVVTGWTTSGFDSTKAAEKQTVTVSYTENEITKTASFNVKIKAAPAEEENEQTPEETPKEEKPAENPEDKTPADDDSGKKPAENNPPAEKDPPAEEDYSETTPNGALTVEPCASGIKVTLRKPTVITAKNSEIGWNQAFVMEKTTNIILDFAKQNIVPTDDEPEVSLIYPFTEAGKKYEFGITYQIYNNSQEFSTWQGESASTKATVTNLKVEDYFELDKNPTTTVLEANADGTISLSEDVRDFFKKTPKDAWITVNFLAGAKNWSATDWLASLTTNIINNGYHPEDFSYKDLLNGADVRPALYKKNCFERILNRGKWAAYDNFLRFIINDEKSNTDYTFTIKMAEASTEVAADGFENFELIPMVNLVTGHENDSTPVVIDSIKYDDNSTFYFTSASTMVQYAKTITGQEAKQFALPEIPGFTCLGLYFDADFHNPVPIMATLDDLILVDSPITLYVRYVDSTDIPEFTISFVSNKTDVSVEPVKMTLGQMFGVNGNTFLDYTDVYKNGKYEKLFDFPLCNGYPIYAAYKDADMTQKIGYDMITVSGDTVIYLKYGMDGITLSSPIITFETNIPNLKVYPVEFTQGHRLCFSGKYSDWWDDSDHDVSGVIPTLEGYYIVGVYDSNGQKCWDEIINNDKTLTIRYLKSHEITFSITGDDTDKFQFSNRFGPELITTFPAKITPEDYYGFASAFIDVNNDGKSDEGSGRMPTDIYLCNSFESEITEYEFKVVRKTINYTIDMDVSEYEKLYIRGENVGCVEVTGKTSGTITAYFDENSNFEDSIYLCNSDGELQWEEYISSTNLSKYNSNIIFGNNNY